MPFWPDFPNSDTEFHMEPFPRRYLIVRVGKLALESLRYHRVGMPSQVVVTFGNYLHNDSEWKAFHYLN